MRVDRLNEMEAYILAHGTASLQELSNEFNISLNSVRRDISSLLTHGNIKKVYGGVASTMQKQLLPYDLREKYNPSGKKVIGQLASEFVPDNSYVFVDSGTTAVNVIPFLAQKENVIIITCSDIVIREAQKYPNLELISLGGRYNPITCSYNGFLTTDSVRMLKIPVALMAASGVSVKHGLSNSTEPEAEIKKVISENSEKIILLADNTKFSRDAVFSFCNFDRLSAIVTDLPLNSEYDEVIQKYGIIVSTPDNPYTSQDSFD